MENIWKKNLTITFYILHKIIPFYIYIFSLQLLKCKMYLVCVC